MKFEMCTKSNADWRYFIGGSGRPDRHGRRRASPPPPVAGKTGEIEPEDLSGNLVVQLGVVTEPPAVKEVQRRIAVSGGWGAALTNPEKSMVVLGDNGASLDRVWPEEHHSGYLRLRDLRKRTPSPPPFSSMNSMPAASIARCSFARASSETRGPTPPSSRLTVGRDSPARWEALTETSLEGHAQRGAVRSSS